MVTNIVLNLINLIKFNFFLYYLLISYLRKKNNQKISGYEIFVGHRRISSLVALGKKNIKVIILGNL